MDLKQRVYILESKIEYLSQMINEAYNYIVDDPMSSLNKSRTVLEKILLQVYQAEMIKEPRKPLLAEMLNDHQFTRKLEEDDRIIARMESIRKLANVGVHGGKVYATDARRVLEDLCEVVEWYTDKYGNYGKQSVLLNDSNSSRIDSDRARECKRRDDFLWLQDCALFEMPDFHDSVIRTDLLANLDREVQKNPIISVEGLAGSGKTYLIASYFKNCPKYDRVLWYDPDEEEPLDNLIASLETIVNFKSPSTRSKCKEFVSILKKNNAVLVIDNFDNVDFQSYSSLVSFALRTGYPARLVILRRTYLDNVADSIEHFPVDGFSISETHLMLTQRNCTDISDEVVESLWESTRGLPLAIGIFSTLVKDYNRLPESLLKGKLLTYERLHSWFKNLCEHVGESGTKLLYFLSLCDEPFNLDIVKLLGLECNLQYPEDIFELLQRSYLVRNYAINRWNIHQLVCSFCKEDLHQDQKRNIYLSLATHYLDGVDLKEVLNDDQLRVVLRACKYYQLAGERKESTAILKGLSKAIKARGFYEIFMNLALNEIQNNSARDPWIDYDFAHCSLITGNIEQGIDLIKSSNRIEDPNPSRRLAFVRIYAELLEASGHPQKALKILDKGLKTCSGCIHSVLTQAASSHAGMLIRQGMIDEAYPLCEYLLAESSNNQSPIAHAVALTYLGIVDYRKGIYDLSAQRLTLASSLFEETGDLRAFSWSLTHLALCEMSAGELNEGLSHFTQAFQIKTDSQESSVEYYSQLKILQPYVDDPLLSKKIDSEIIRMDGVFGQL